MSKDQKIQSSIQKRANGQGSVYRFTNNRWRATISDINGRLRTKVFKLKKDADVWLEQQRRAKEQGLSTYATNPKISLILLGEGT